MTTEEKKALLQRFRKNRTNTYALKLVLPEGLSLESAKIYLKILDDVESSMNRIEKSLYVLGRDLRYLNSCPYIIFLRKSRIILIQNLMG